MRDVHAAVLRRYSGKRDELAGRRIRRRRVDERRGEPERALLHRAFKNVLFLFQLHRVCGPIRHPHHLLTEHRDRRERAEIDRRALRLERAEITVEAVPVELETEPLNRHIVRVLFGPERRRAAFANDLGGNALADVAFSVAVGKQRHARLSLHVDEPGRHHPTAGVDLLSAAARHVPDGRNPAAAHGNVRATRRRTGAIDDVAVSNDQVVAGPAGDGCDHAGRAAGCARPRPEPRRAPQRGNGRRRSRRTVRRG